MLTFARLRLGPLFGFLSQICPAVYSKPRRTGQIDTNGINGLDRVSLLGFAQICAKLELKIRYPQGSASSSPPGAAYSFGPVDSNPPLTYVLIRIENSATGPVMYGGSSG